jgi:hypothetical protein
VAGALGSGARFAEPAVSVQKQRSGNLRDAIVEEWENKQLIPLLSGSLSLSFLNIVSI